MTPPDISAPCPNGFTLIEIVLSLALMAIIAAFTIPVFQAFQVKNSLQVAENAVVQSMRRASILASATQDDTNWGVSVLPGTITIFKGGSYASRDSAFDETFTLPESVTPAGVTEIVFQKLTGYPLTTGTLSLTSATGDTATVTINSKGVISY